ncbi:MAG: pantothenate kinase [Candidatus Solincola sediminis]|uniref:Type III pantothenate kinase n=1 Tax=Candidatus Solincola sediminis TaxID=1797199 RepID=A0A1F2WQ60_9ACTN|nr:MAG: pantothenate kinase [Candidatus Solincola sediminis]OFW61481.1 MAG: pantothenate kinase [Candidatus Solincola sediminis]
MLLAIDVGNTQTVIGAYRESELVGHWRVSTDANKTGDELALYYQGFLVLKGMSFAEFDAVIISSVVPSATLALEEMTRDYWDFQPLIVGQNIEAGIKVLMDNPSEVGPDRLVNAVAAFERFGGPSLVVDFGTATTFDAISVKGDYLGGVIAPGIEISTRALFNAAARLSRVDLHRPPDVIGKNTVSSLQSGIIYGFAGQVDRIVGLMKDELGGEATVIATGGLAEVIVSECQTIQAHDPLLTLHGLRLIYEKI